MKKFNEVFEAIFTFNREILKAPRHGFRLLTKAEALYTGTCLKEEALELIEASNQGEIVGQIDALADCLYFAVGGFYRAGFPVELIIYELETNHPTVYAGNCQGPILLLGKDYAANVRMAIDVEADNLVTSNELSNMVGQTASLGGTIVACLEGLHMMGLSDDQAIQVLFLVHAANMSKKQGVNAKRDLGVEDAVKPANFVPPEAAIKKLLEII